MYSSRVPDVPALKVNAGSSSRLKKPDAVLTQPPRCKCSSPLGGGVQGSSQPSPKFNRLSGVKGVSVLPIADRNSTSPKLCELGVIEAAPPPKDWPNATLAKMSMDNSAGGKTDKREYRIKFTSLFMVSFWSLAFTLVPAAPEPTPEIVTCGDRL